MARVVIAPEVARLMNRKMRARVEGMGDQAFRCLVCGDTDQVGASGAVHVIVYMDDKSASVRFAHEFCAPSQVIEVPGLSRAAKDGETGPGDAAFFVRAQAKPRPLLLYPLRPSEDEDFPLRQLLETGFQRLLAPVHLCVPATVDSWALELSRKHLRVRREGAEEPAVEQELASVEPGFLAALRGDGRCVLVTGQIDLDQIEIWPDDLQPFLDEALEAELLVGATVTVRDVRRRAV